MAGSAHIALEAPIVSRAFDRVASTISRRRQPETTAKRSARRQCRRFWNELGN